MNNIIKRTWNQNRLFSPEGLFGMLFQQEAGAHTFEISGINDAEEAVPISGMITAVFMRPDSTDVALTGSVTDGIASVTLSADCYAVPGHFGLAVFATENNVKTAIYAAIGTITTTTTGAVAGSTPADVVDLVNAINTAIAGIPADYTQIMAAIAPTYSANATYEKDAYAWYDGDLYRADVDITTAETFTASHWIKTSFAEDVGKFFYLSRHLEDANISPNRINGYRINVSHNSYEASNGSILVFPITETGEYKFFISSMSNLYAYVYTTASTVSDIVSANYVKALTVESANYLAYGTVEAGQYVCLTRPDLNFTATAKIYRSSANLKNNIGLTDQMMNELPSKYGDIALDALLYADRVPSYYIDTKQTPTSYEDATPYLEQKISQIPNKNGFAFITDVHWLGNQKHSTDLLNYIRKRTGIEKVLFGGDVYGNAQTKYLAVQVLGEYLYQSRQAFNMNFIPCVGDHDNNTVNVSNEYVPYSVLSDLFIGDVKYNNYVCYAPTEKLAQFATGDNFDEIMDFFKTVYFVDCPELKTRIIVLNCGNAGNTGALYDVFGTTGTDLLRLQIPFLIDSLYSTAPGWNVCLLSHKVDFAGSAGYAVLMLMSLFKMKASYAKSGAASSGLPNIEAWWSNNTQYNFSDAPDLGLIFGLCGHQHVDGITWAGYATQGGSFTRYNAYSGQSLDQPVLGQIPYIVTATDSVQAAESGSPSMTVGTVTEQCFDIVNIVSDGLILTRIGAGQNRRVYIGGQA